MLSEKDLRALLHEIGLTIGVEMKKKYQRDNLYLKIEVHVR